MVEKANLKEEYLQQKNLKFNWGFINVDLRKSLPDLEKLPSIYSEQGKNFQFQYFNRENLKDN